MAFKPIVLKNCDLVFGDATESQQFKCQVNTVKLTPDANVIREKTACPSGVYAEVETAEWSLEIGHLTGMDETTATAALGEYLRVNAGDKVPFAFRPFSGSAKGGYKGYVMLVPAELGGQVSGFNTATVSLPLSGQPEPLTEAEKDEDSPAVFS